MTTATAAILPTSAPARPEPGRLGRLSRECLHHWAMTSITMVGGAAHADEHRRARAQAELDAAALTAR